MVLTRSGGTVSGETDRQGNRSHTGSPENLSLPANGDAIRPTTLLEPQRKVEDGAGLDDLDLWTVQWKRSG
jgi:hypothetical protein